VFALLPAFHGTTGDAVNERRTVRAIAQESGTEAVYVFAITGMAEIRHSRERAKNSKISVFTVPRVPLPSCCQLCLIVQFVLYGFVFGIIAILMKACKLIDVLYVRDAYLAFGPVSLRRILGTVAAKVVSTATDEMLFERKRVALRDLTVRLGHVLESYVVRNAGIVFTVPGSIGGRLAQTRGRSEGIVELPQPIPTMFHMRRRLRKRHDQYVVGYVGYISRLHRVETVIRAMQLVQREIPRARLLVVGEGDPSEVAQMRGLIKALGVKGSIRLRIPENMMPDIYKSLDVVVIPRSEMLGDAVPMKLLEAVVAKVPIVASKSSAISRLLAGSGVKDLVLVGDDEPGRWASTIRSLLTKEGRREYVVGAMSRHLRSRLELHRPEAVGKRFLAALEVARTSRLTE
jgi:glycosyltransferase involved in cell wall biosynthesis